MCLQGSKRMTIFRDTLEFYLEIMVSVRNLILILNSTVNMAYVNRKDNCSKIYIFLMLNSVDRD